MSYKITGKDLFTVESVTKPNKELKPEIKERLEIILDIMKNWNITKVEI